MPQHPEHWLYHERGLASDRPTAGATFLEPQTTTDDAPQYVDATLPADYVARVEALREAMEWTRMNPLSPERTLQRALDFHAFLMGRETKEPVHTDD